MERLPAQSETIRSIGYDAATATLEIEFHERGTYRYFDVPEFLYRGMLVAASKGAYFNKRIASRFHHEEV